MSSVESVQEVIRAQLEAFSRGDHLAAFALSSEAIRRQFDSAEDFGDRVRRGHPQLYHARRIEFGAPRAVQQRVAQPAEVTGEDGITLLTLFWMIPEEHDGWRI